VTIPREPILPPEVQRRLLTRDPFEDPTEQDPLLERLEALGRMVEVGAPSGPGSEPQLPGRSAHSRAPRLSEVDLPERPGWIDRLLGEDEQRRLASLSHLVEQDAAYDRFGFSPEAARRAFPFFFALYRAYFRVQSQNHEHIPLEGPALLVGNHGGLLPFDGAMCIVDVLLHTDPPRLVRSIVERWAGTLPFVNVFYSRVGQVIGTRENFSDLLSDGQLVLVFPEGVEGIRKRITQRYRLQSFHVGFVEEALRARAPIVPVAFIGTDDQAPILYDIKPLAKRLGLPAVPITPTFPWFGPLGLLPYPVRYRIVYGEPLHFEERFGPEAAEDSRLVHYLAKQVRRRVQNLVDKNR
jgi:1-acyl-sn-glycerol-3-phosphate acyltransferase